MRRGASLRRGPVAFVVLVVAIAACSCAPASGPQTESKSRAGASTYDAMVLAMKPFAYYHIAGIHDTEPDLAGDSPGVWSPGGVRLAHARLPDGTEVVDFHAGDYLTVPSAPGFSISTTAKFTVISWIRPDTLQFAVAEGSGYVYWLGKGQDGAQEWALRMYSLSNQENRPNRISGYVYNLDGGEGSGAYVQDPVNAGQWIMIGFEVDLASSRQYPTGWVAIYKNGVERDQVGLDQFDVTPEFGTAPVRVGARDLESFFQGGIGDVAFFDHLVAPSGLQSLYDAMTAGSSGS